MGTLPIPNAHDQYSSLSVRAAHEASDVEATLPGCVHTDAAHPLAGRHIRRILDDEGSDLKIRKLKPSLFKRALKGTAKVASCIIKTLENAEKSPFFSPERADVHVYPEGCEELKKKAKFVKNIKNLESMGAGFFTPMAPISMPLNSATDMTPFLEGRNTIANAKARTRRELANDPRFAPLYEEKALNDTGNVSWAGTPLAAFSPL